jgi:uncharacterized membrane protein YkoI
MALGLTMAVPTAFADDLSFDDLPPPVQQTVEREVGDGQITDVDREQHRDETLYEVEFDRGAKEYELEVAPDGTVVRLKED